VKLNGPLPTGGDVQTSFLISPDGTRVVYLADQTTNNVFELFSRPIDGSGSPVELNGTLIGGGDVQGGFVISPDSTRVVYLADQTSDGVFELFSRPIDGSGSAVKLNSTPVSGGDVLAGFRISPDSAWVVYSADQNADGLVELFSRPIDGSGAATDLSNGFVISDFLISADSTRVAYRKDSGALDLYSRVIDGSAVAVKLNGTLPGFGEVNSFAISSDSARVVYNADQDVLGRDEIYSRPIDGSGASVKLNDTLAGGGDVLPAFLISPDGTRVFYLAPQDISGVTELYSRAIDGSGTSTKLNGTLTTGGDVLTGVLISADSTRVAYRADEVTDTVIELFSRPSDGSGTAIKLNGTLALGGAVAKFRITADSSRAVYAATQEQSGQNDLYSRPIDGSGSAVKLDGAEGIEDFEVSGNSARVVYVTTATSTAASDLYSRAVDGSGTSVKLNDSIPNSDLGVVGPFRISPNSARVVFAAYQLDPNDSSVFDLFSRPLDGSGAPVKLNPQFYAYSGSQDFLISSDSTRVVYRADPDGFQEIFSAPIDGSAAAVKINGELQGEIASGDDYRISSDSTWVVYLADQDTYGVPEVYSRQARWLRHGGQAERHARQRRLCVRVPHQPGQQPCRLSGRAGYQRPGAL